MKHLICICGKSASGKNTICKELEKMYGYKRLVTYTTRPMHTGEEDGVDYNFIAKERLEALIADGAVIEYRTYDHAADKVVYATVSDNQFLYFDDENVIVSSSLIQCKNYIDRWGADIVKPVYLTVLEDVLFMRAIRREQNRDNPDYPEMCHCYLSELKEYNDFNKGVVGIGEHNTFINDSVWDCATNIHRYIQDEL